MNRYSDEDFAPERKSSQSRRTCPAALSRSDDTDCAKKMKLTRSTGNLEMKAYYTTNVDRNLGQVGRFKRYVNADCRPTYSPARGAGRNSDENEGNMDVQGRSLSNEDHGAGDRMNAENEDNVGLQTHPSTPRKEFPAPAGFTIPGIQHMESYSSEDNGGYQRLSPPLDVEDLHIGDSRYSLQSFSEFTNRSNITAQRGGNTHHIRHHMRNQHSVHSSISDLLDLDMRDGRNRLKTFRAFWPEESKFFNSTVLASEGFYATGAGDAVCCFACKATIANWEKDDDPKRRHLEVSPNCRFANGFNCGNRPLSPVRNSKKNPAGSSPVKSNARGRSGYPRHSQDGQRVYPSYRTNPAPRQPIMSHRTSSASPRRSSTRRSESGRIHRNNSLPPSSPMAQEPAIPRVVAMTQEPAIPRVIAMAQEPATPEEAAMTQEPAIANEYGNLTPSLIERSNRMDVFSCQNPENPAMRELSARLATFDNPEFRANTRLRDNNLTLAEAGMYYTGQSDDTKCWYCGGGLRRYQPEDDPWLEHAKFFPECEYLLQQRGPGWIHRISVQYPNIVRPAHPTMHNLAVPPLRPALVHPLPVARQQNAPVSPTMQQPVPVAPRRDTPIIIQGQFQPTPLVMPHRTQPIRLQRQATQVLPQISEPRQPSWQHQPMSPPPVPSSPPHILNLHPERNAPQQVPPPPPPAPSGPRNLRTIRGEVIEDPQSMIQEREQMVDASMHTEAVQEARNMGFTDDQIRIAQMRRVVGLGGPYHTTNLLIEALINPTTDPAVLEPADQQLPPRQRGNRRTVNIRNGRINITGGSFTRAVFGTDRGRSNIIIDGVPLHEYVARSAEEAAEQGVAAQHVFNNVGTSVGTQPYHTAPNPLTAPMNEETTTTNSNDTPSSSTTNPPDPTGTTEERLEALQKEYQCKICYSAPVEVLFEPCGHICACLNCGSRVTQCPMCRRRISRYIRTYHC